METKIKKSFNTRAFVSVAMFTSLLALPFSGYMNHILQFETLTTARHFWMSVHDVAAILFAAFSIVHIYLNRRVLLNYVHKLKTVAVSKEAILAVILIVFIVGFISMHAFHAG